MSIFLSESHRMLKADSQRPGRYFGWFSHGHDGLLYLTYFTNNFIGSEQSYDSPVVRDNSIPLIQGQTSEYNPDFLRETLGSGQVGLPDSFRGIDCQEVKFKTTNYNKSYCDTFKLPWVLPFESNDVWSMTFRAYYPTNQSISVQYSQDDTDTYWLNPSVGLQCGTPYIEGSNLFGTGNFDTERYPKKVLCTYKQSTEENPNVWPTDFPNVTEYNGTSYDTFKDATYDGGSGPWPPYGRLFHSMSNSAITEINGDQWFYTVIVSHGDGTVSIYVNGLRILNVPFEYVWYLVLYVGAKKFSGAEYIYTSNLQYMKVTEVSLWGKDLSILNRSQVPVPTQPIYKKENGVYVPNDAY